MKVVHLETGQHLYGGAQQVLYLSDGLQRRGIDSSIVCSAGSDIDIVARQRGLSVHPLHCAGEMDLSFVFRLRALLARLTPQLLHCHSRRGADLFGGRAAGLAGVPAVLSRRVDSVDNGLIAALRYAPYESIIAISQTVRQALIRSGVDPARIVTIRSAVDTAALSQPLARHRWLAEFDLGDQDVVAVVVAQLIERKGHRHLLQVLPAVCRAHPEFRVILFGVGPLEAQLRHQVAQLGLTGQVRFAGFRGDLDCLLGCADLLVHPALKEGLGIAMLKASAAALPVLAFDIAGATEAVLQRETGLLVPAADEKSLLHALTQLIENPAMRNELGQAGQSRMRTEFSLDVLVDEHIELYESITNG